MCTAVTTLDEMDAFFKEVRNAKERVLLLDYDGTLAPFHSNRQAALPYLGVPELLISLIMGETHTQVILITGRPAEELKSLLPFTPAPEIWGSHGMERLKPDGSYEMAGIPRTAAQLLGAIDRCLEREWLEPYMERKPGAIAVHWRGLSEWQAIGIREQALKVWGAVQHQDLVLASNFDGGLEFRVRMRNKGDAVRQILSESDDETPVAYLGDDYTDEDAFKALRERGLSVLVREQYRPTAARAWIRPPEGLLAFLSYWLEACDAMKKVHYPAQFKSGLAWGTLA